MAIKGIHAWVAVAGIALASGGGWWLLNKPASQTADGASPGAGTNKGSAPAAGAPAPVRAAGVEVSKVEQSSLRDDAQAVGTLRSRQNTVLRPEVAGRISALGFTDGSRVRKGQLLVKLDDALQAAEIKQAQAQVAIARANYKRNQELVAQAFVAQRVLDESQATLQVAEAQLALAEARLQRMTIVAPFDGTVGIRSVNVGDFVKDGADLVNLEDISSLYVDFRLPSVLCHVSSVVSPWRFSWMRFRDGSSRPRWKPLTRWWMPTVGPLGCVPCCPTRQVSHCSRLRPKQRHRQLPQLVGVPVLAHRQTPVNACCPSGVAWHRVSRRGRAFAPRHVCQSHGGVCLARQRTDGARRSHRAAGWQAVRHQGGSR
jgi:biotin carboxyl carrier protein